MLSPFVRLLFNPYEEYVDLCNPSYLVGRPSCMANYGQTFQPHILAPALLIGTIYFYHFIPHLVSLALPGVTRYVQCKIFCFIFARTYHLIRMKFDVMLKQFKWNVLILLFSNINSGFMQCVKKKVVMQLDVYKPIWFKLGRMIYCTIVYILILV